MIRQVANRFRIEREVGRGGVGVVYRAFDEQSGAPVALKLLAAEAGAAPKDEQRLLNEAALLAEIDHPNVVRVLSAGRCSSHHSTYVAMEWLDGEDLAERQRKAPLSLLHCLDVAAQICDALSATHVRGIIHRDIKPANVFLCASASESESGSQRVKLVDFGVALTQSANEGEDVVGTPAYMSPEQVRGETELTPAADLYSLGALLFELIAGRPPHVGITRVATLARLATTRAPRLSELKRDVPPAIDDFVAMLLTLSPADRPQEASAVATSLRELREHTHEIGEISREDPARTTRLGSSASRLVTSMVAMCFESPSLREQALDQLRHSGADATPLGSDALVAHFGVRRAQGTEARTALEAARRLAQANSQVGVASGRVRLHSAMQSGTPPVGDVVDRASALARDAQRGTVLVDATTSELCRGRYEFRARGGGSAILGDPLRDARAAGGAPFVGRESELAQVLNGCERARTERMAVLITITGLPGIGKSRLRREVLARIGALADATRVVVQRSDSYGRRHALGCAADVIRSLLGLARGSSLAEAKKALDEHWGGETDHGPTSEGRALLAGLLADQELPSGDGARAVRDLLWLAMTGLLLRTAHTMPVAIVLEDLQWADFESVAFFDHLLGQASALPLCVIATMRTDFWNTHPERFVGRDHVRLELGPMSQRSTRTLAQALLGDGVPAETLELVVQQSAGSPLFAEELARLIAAGRDTTHAPTIEAAIQASLDGLDDASRDAVGRLSVLGLTGWDSGLQALGLEGAPEALRKLAASELLVEQDVSRFADAREWSFKHALVRDVAYNSLGEDERKSLHTLAADWLAQMGEDAAVVADHYDAGGQHGKAADYWEKAAQRALTTNSLKDALVMSERALAFAEGKPSGFLRARILDEAWNRLDPKASDRASSVSALDENVYDDVSALYAAGARVRYDNARGAGQEISERLSRVRDDAARLGLHDEEARCSAALATRLAFAGELLPAEAEATRLLRLSQAQGVLSAAVDAWQTLAITRQTHGALSAALDARRSAIDAAHAAGLREREAILTTNLGFALTTIGARQEARTLLDQGLSLSEALGSSGAARHARMILLGWAATFGNDRRLDATLSQLRTDTDSSASGAWTAPDRENLGALYYRGCELLLFGGPSSLERARQLLRIASDAYRLTENRDVLPVALGMRALAELRSGETERALTLALEAAQLLEGGAPSLLNESTVYLALHDIQLKLGREAEARHTIGRGMVPLVRRVHGLKTTAYARMFLTELPHNSTLVSRAEALGLLPDALAVVLEQGTS